MRILTLCQRGNVRSATAAVVLRDFYGMNDCIATGVQTTTPETMALLTEWADWVAVCGDESLLPFVPENVAHKTVLIPVGADVWGRPMHPELVERLVSLLGDKLSLSPAGIFYSDAQAYINANAAAQRSL